MVCSWYGLVVIHVWSWMKFCLAWSVGESFSLWVNCSFTDSSLGMAAECWPEAGLNTKAITVSRCQSRLGHSKASSVSTHTTSTSDKRLREQQRLHGCCWSLPWSSLGRGSSFSAAGRNGSSCAIWTEKPSLGGLQRVIQCLHYVTLGEMWVGIWAPDVLDVEMAQTAPRHYR